MPCFERVGEREAKAYSKKKKENNLTFKASFKFVVAFTSICATLMSVSNDVVDSRALPASLYELEIATRSPRVARFLMSKLNEMISRKSLDEDCIKLWRQDEDEGLLEPEVLDTSDGQEPASTGAPEASV